MLVYPLNIYSEDLTSLSVCVPYKWEKNKVESFAIILGPKLSTKRYSFKEWVVLDETFESGMANPCDCNKSNYRKHWLLKPNPELGR